MSVMSHEAGFHQALLEQPEDAASWSAFADWLTEQDDPRGELLRLLHTLAQTVDVPDRPGQERRLRELLAAGGRHPGPLFTNSRGMAFAWVPPGTFLMGSPEDEPERLEETRHRVTLTKGFWMGVHPVTETRWQAVLGHSPYAGNFRGKDLPMLQVSWDDGQEFARKLGEREGRAYRLPTEAEWECACRAGSATPFSFGDTITRDQANYNWRFTYGGGVKGGGSPKTSPVGSYPPNAFGLHDMHGNAWEWCQDWYGPYPRKEVKDPLRRQPIDYPQARVLRGGCWNDAPGLRRSARRGWAEPESRALSHGVRVCCSRLR